MWKAYLDGHEKRLLHDMRDGGKMSFYRLAPCRRCGDDTRKDVPYCSKRCYLIAKELKMGEGKFWDEEIAKLIGKKVQVETLDGIYLNGKLSTVRIREVSISNTNVPLPIELELDGDSEKVIDVSRLKKITEG